VREVEISHEGETVRAYELEFTTEADNWGEYKTEEGDSHKDAKRGSSNLPIT
jgi:hypothetical protein